MSKTLTVKVDDETYEWFSEFLPMHGSTQWFLESCILEARRLHEQGKIESPVDLVSLTVSEVSGKSL